MSTCHFCLEGRHVACANVLECSCSVCRAGRAAGKRSTAPKAKSKGGPRPARQLTPEQKARHYSRQQEWRIRTGRATGKGTKAKVQVTETHTRETLALLKFGVSQSETARLVGISRDQVRLIAEKAGLLKARPSRTVSDEPLTTVEGF